jgi:hypothetical protein
MAVTVFPASACRYSADPDSMLSMRGRLSTYQEPGFSLAASVSRTLPLRARTSIWRAGWQVV